MKQYKCGYCGKEYARKSYFIAHNARCAHKQAIANTVNFNGKFKNWDLLDFKCICGKEFKTHTLFYAHTRKCKKYRDYLDRRAKIALTKKESRFTSGQKRAIKDGLAVVGILIFLGISLVMLSHVVNSCIKTPQPINESVKYLEGINSIQYETPEPVIDTTLLLRSLLMQRIRPGNKYDSILIFSMIYSCKEFPPSFLLAIAWNESNFNPGVTGTIGEKGLFQVLPSTATWHGFTMLDRLYEIEYNILVATTVLKDYLKAYGTKIQAMNAYTTGGRSTTFAMKYMALMESRTREHLWIKNMSNSLY